jgi:hypothetical protein
MRTKSILVLAVVFLFDVNMSFANDRIPFCKSLTVAPEVNQIIITAAANERFVLRKLYADSPIQNWHLDVDNQVLLAGTISVQISSNNFVYKTYVHDFPDSCVVVPAGKTLTAANKNSTGYKLELTVIGYFETIDTGLMADLNGDQKVDLQDFALFADQWLDSSS